MAAGLGFKDFVTGEVLTAADVDGYLMQGVWVFASAAARDAAVTSPQEGNFAYLKDTNVTTYYTGSAWANLDTTGMTNPMTTTGDTIYSSSGSTPARLGIGTTGQVLTVAAGVPSWATPAAGGGGKVLQVVMGSTSTDTGITSTTFTDTNLSASITPTLSSSKVLILVTQQVALFKDVGNIASGFQILRDSTVIASRPSPTAYGVASTANTARLRGNYAFNYLDSPATTSSTTYKTQARVDDTGSGGDMALNQSSLSTMILLEIGA
jgi:hypothetical protein